MRTERPSVRLEPLVPGVFAALVLGLAWVSISAAQDVVVPATPVPTATETAAGQVPAKPQGYQFEIDRMLDATGVKDQGRTGTCWSFATASFVESEVVRKGGPAIDLSEMFIVRNMYEEKARIFLLRQGKTNFGQGALAHDYFNNIARCGLVPEEAYPGNGDGATGAHDHDEMEAALGGMLKGLAEKGRLGSQWQKAVASLLDVYLGQQPAGFQWQGKSMTPLEFRDHLGIQAEDYVNLTSFSHHPFGKPFVLEIPDNVSSGQFENVPLDELLAIINRALDAGYTVAWDGDVSESSFLGGEGIAVIPPTDRSLPWRTEPVGEPAIDQAARQAAFESLETTDDHLMHLVGRAHDQNGETYYIVKNSWGPQGKFAGHIYLSEAYVRLKTIAITVHKDVVEPAKSGAPAGPSASGDSGSLR